MLVSDAAARSLLRPSATYRPLVYPWAEQAAVQQQRIHWLPDEVPMTEDIKDWAALPENERKVLTSILRFFTQSDCDVFDGYVGHYLRVFRNAEIQRMLVTFAAMETVHIRAYAQILDTLGLPDREFQAFIDIAAMVRKHDYLKTFGTGTPVAVACTLAAYGAFVEGMQLFSTFAIMLNYPRQNKMRGMGQIVTWSARDESLHAASVIRLWREYMAETGLSPSGIEPEIRAIADRAVRLEDDFIDEAFSGGSIEGLSPTELKRYIRHIADFRLAQLGYAPMFDIRSHPLPWLDTHLNALEFANFFETRSTEYSKGAIRGSFPEAWKLFEDRAAQKAAPISQ